MISSELRDIIDQYLDEKIALSQLEEWIVPRLPIYLKSPNSNDASLIAAIELGLAEISEGIQNEASFRNMLREELKMHTFMLRTVHEDDVTEWNVTGTASQTIMPNYSYNIDFVLISS